MELLYLFDSVPCVLMTTNTCLVVTTYEIYIEISKQGDLSQHFFLIVKILKTHKCKRTRISILNYGVCNEGTPSIIQNLS